MDIFSSGDRGYRVEIYFDSRIVIVRSVLLILLWLSYIELPLHCKSFILLNRPFCFIWKRENLSPSRFAFLLVYSLFRFHYSLLVYSLFSIAGFRKAGRLKISFLIQISKNRTRLVSLFYFSLPKCRPGTSAIFWKFLILKFIVMRHLN